MSPLLRSAREAISDKLKLYTAVPGISASGMQSLKQVFNSYEIPPVETPGASILECQPLHVENGEILDTQGRRRILKGINVDSAMKLPVAPFMPSYEGESCDSKNVFFEGDHVSFVGRPFPLDTAESHLVRIKSMGYNTIRYLVTWEALEHAGPGKYDEDFVNYTVEVLRIIYKVGGLYVFLEPHQDVWSRYCGGSGAPMWTLHAAGLEPKRFGACEAALLHNNDQFEYSARNDPEAYPKMLWTSNYKRLASLVMFTLFFAGATYFPDLIIDGVNIQHYLQKCHLESLQHLWKVVVDQLPEMLENGSLLGFESLNEPNNGLVGAPNMATIPSSQQLRIGTTPAIYESFRLGMGLPVEVDNFKITITGPQKSGRVIVDPRGQSAWLSPDELVTVDTKYGWKRSGWEGKCIFASRGIWSWDETDFANLHMSSQAKRLAFSSDNCQLLQPDYFNEVTQNISDMLPEGETPEVVDQEFFTNHFFVDYYIKFKEMVRSVAPDVFVLIQPPVLEEPPHLKDDPREIIDSKTIYCPHYYDGLSLMFKSWNYIYNVDTLGIMRGRYLNPVLGVVLGERAIRNCLKRQFVEIKQEGQRFLGVIPVLMSETGMPFDMDSKRAYEDGRYHMQTAALDALANALEGSGMHHTYWCYNSINCHKWGDRWNNEDFSFWSPDDREVSPEKEYSGSSNSSFKSDSVTSRKSSLTPSLRSLRELKDRGGTAEFLKTRIAQQSKKMVPGIFKSSYCAFSSDEPQTSSVEDSSLIFNTPDNIRYKHFKQCYSSPDGIRAPNAVIRPFVVASLGTVNSQFDMKSSRFALTVTLQGANQTQIETTPTIIFTPKWHYPYLSQEDIFINEGFVRYDEGNECVEWYHYTSEENSLTSITMSDITEHTIIIKNHSGTLGDLEAGEESRTVDCPVA